MPRPRSTNKLARGDAAGLVSAAALSIVLAAAVASAPAPPPESRAAARPAMEFFEKNVRPVLATQCYTCHGPTLHQGGLQLNTREGLLKGGAHGPAVVPGNPERSLLLKAVKQADASLKMPPGRKLSNVEIAALSAWVKMGAPWGVESSRLKVEGSERRPNQQPSTNNLPPSTGHWSFQPVRLPAAPAVKNRAWVKTPVDAFVLARLEAAGLKPEPPADRRTLIRRVTFDLTGLPPTPEEVEAFVSDRSADAWEKVVDRLLASPAYGERWGRHWLDVARYADSNGMDENVHYGNAWRYRDYVIGSVNADKPFDRFIREQIAGDLLPAADEAKRREQLIATGFFAIGPKLISEVDSQKVQMDIIDEQIDTLGRAFMGMTFGCARCHDHKFDPITTEDYYALAGIFKSTQTLTVWQKPRMWFEHSLASGADKKRQAEFEKQAAEKKSAIDAAVAKAKQELQAQAKPGTRITEAALPAPARAELKRMRDELAQLEKSAPQPQSCMGVTDAKVEDQAVCVRGDFLNPGKVVPRRFPIVLAGQNQPRLDDRHSGRLQLADWVVSPSNPLTARVLVNRVWRWHFGQGIVRSVDNFGRLGEKPSDPALLDWLAATFVAGARGRGPEAGRPPRVAGSGEQAINLISAGPRPPTPDPYSCGWSLKRLHRLLLLSSTYQTGSAYDPRSAAVDPENRLHWRFGAQRLEAEEIRDTLLAASGLLDRTMGGTLIKMKNREYFFDHTSKDQTQYDSRRRSVYLPVVRNHLYDVFHLFDFGDAQVPQGDRPVTTVAPQALFMMNSDLVQDAAEALAAAVLKRPGLDTPGRLRALYERLYARGPEAKEIRRDQALLARFDRAQSQEPDAARRERRSWAWLCHVALATNEFIYVE